MKPPNPNMDNWTGRQKGEISNNENNKMKTLKLNLISRKEDVQVPNTDKGDCIKYIGFRWKPCKNIIKRWKRKQQLKMRKS